MWLLTSSEGNRMLCHDIEKVTEHIKSNWGLVWTVEYIPIKTNSIRSPTEILLNSETGKVEEKRRSEAAPVPLGRSGDTE